MNTGTTKPLFPRQSSYIRHAEDKAAVVEARGYEQGLKILVSSHFCERH